jgi:hypothetical protein
MCKDLSEITCKITTVAVSRKIERAPQGPVDVIVDSTGLKVCGQGEWHSQKHGEKKVKRWKKLHVGVDDQGQIVASTVTESNEQDPSQVPQLLDQIDEEIGRFIGDGIFGRVPVQSVGRSLCLPTVPVRGMKVSLHTAPQRPDTLSRILTGRCSPWFRVFASWQCPCKA